MIKKTFKLAAWVDAKKLQTIKFALEDLASRMSVFSTDAGFFLKATIRGADARKFNQRILTALRRVEPRAALSAEWRCGTSTEWFLDNTWKGSLKNCKSPNVRREYRRSTRLISRRPQRSHHRL